MFGSVRVRLFAILGLGAVALGVSLSAPSDTSAAIRDGLPGANYQSSPMVPSQQSQKLQAKATLINDRMAIKDALIVELLGGRLSLQEVAQRFAEINQDTPESFIMIQRRYPKLSGEELMAVNVLDFVHAHLDGYGERELIVCRLLVEFERNYGHRYENIN